jgi:hypothetical protein
VRAAVVGLDADGVEPDCSFMVTLPGARRDHLARRFDRKRSRAALPILQRVLMQRWWGVATIEEIHALPLETATELVQQRTE